MNTTQIVTLLGEQLPQIFEGSNVELKAELDAQKKPRPPVYRVTLEVALNRGESWTRISKLLLDRGMQLESFPGMSVNGRSQMIIRIEKGRYCTQACIWEAMHEKPPNFTVSLSDRTIERKGS